nr:hypothetical protein [Tanacetum cinerariifolium]
WVSDDEPQSLEYLVPSDNVPGPEYPEYLVPSDDVVPIKDQPLLTDASPTALLPGYVADFDPSKEDLEEDLADYPADGGDDDEKEEESSKDDDDDESDIPEMDIPFRKRLCLTDPTYRFEVEESLTTAASRHIGHTFARRVDYRYIDTLDASIRASKSIAMTAVDEVNERVTDLTTTRGRDIHENAQDDRALMRADDIK